MRISWKPDTHLASAASIPTNPTQQGVARCANAVGKAALKGWEQVLVPALIDNSVRLWPFQGKLESLFLPGPTVIEETLPGRVLRRVLRRPLRAKTYIESRREFGSNLLRPEQGTGLPLIITAAFTATEQWLNRGIIASSCTPIASIASNSTQRC